MAMHIGEAAGKVWHYLKEKGPSTANQIQKGVGADVVTIHLALGWLAREGKIAINRDKRSAVFSLVE